MRVDARRFPVKEEHLLTVHTSFFQEGPHQKMFFHLQESEDERRARLDEERMTSLDF